MSAPEPRPWSAPAGMPARYWPKPSEIEQASLACACCGVSTPFEGAAHAEVSRGWQRQFPPARFCPGCRTVVKGNPVRAVAGLIDPDDPAAPDVWRSLLWYSDLGDRLSPTGPWDAGAPTRWAHVASGVVEDIVAEQRERARAKPSPSGHGCGGCGVSVALSWRTNAVMTRSSAWRPACLSCWELLEFVGFGERFADRLAARAAGLTEVPFGVELASLIGFEPYAKTLPDGPGTDEPFAWLGDDLGALQDFAGHRWPRLLPDSQRVPEPRGVPAPRRAGLRLDRGVS